MKKYKHIYFDLDCTLWDFKSNSREALHTIFNRYGLFKKIDDFDLFVEKYAVHNERLWEAYRRGRVKKAELRVTRFNNTLKDFGIKDIELAKLIDADYIIESPCGRHLVPHATDLLDYLNGKYFLYIVTNGFKDVQYVKMETSGLLNYFSKVFTSDEIGYPKPDKRFFKEALSFVNAGKQESLVVGDDLEIDIIGARNYGIDQVYFNPTFLRHNEIVTYEVGSLEEIKDIL